MKHTIRKLSMAVALILALACGVMALAETAEPEDAALPSTEDAAPASEAEDSTALEDAFEAYNSARESSYAEDLAEELDEYVAAGKMTREQADLILNYCKEQQSLRDGVCPNCGYEFQSGGFGKGGHMNRGGRGRGGMCGMGGCGMRGMYSR